MYIRSLKNLQTKDSVDILLGFAEGEARKPAIAAARALQIMPSDYLNSEALKRLERIFLELGRQHDSSVRAMAADILLQNKPTEEFVKSLLEIMSSQSARELNTVLLGRLWDLASSDDNLQKVSVEFPAN
ncbi:Microsomal triglyceride transfer protein large subunit [Portunus trituberculatus]|uniref:Microsomal triglyceride transfer protein large subunit n=1 Tax=Portunus trituberculatus TaxID=210409 RepID=A0A5B7J007_PORTR|nr:Microsomal triglyceride transfer protein large subunit [Portunus trituberculatus]